MVGALGGLHIAAVRPGHAEGLRRLVGILAHLGIHEDALIQAHALLRAVDIDRAVLPAEGIGHVAGDLEMAFREFGEDVFCTDAGDVSEIFKDGRQEAVLLVIEFISECREHADAALGGGAAADPDAVRGETREEQSRDIEQIMIRESPTALFIAEEVFAVREYLSPVNASAKTLAPVAEESPRE